MSNYLVISSLGEDRPGLIRDLSETIVSCGCNIADSRMSILGGEFATIILVSGPWNSIVKLEDAVPALQEKLGLMIVCKRTEERKLDKNEVPYLVEVMTLDHPGIVHKVADFFSKHDINIHDMQTGSYHAAHTGTLMFTLNMTVEIPAKTHIATLREQFMEFSDELNMDAVMEPMKM